MLTHSSKPALRHVIDRHQPPLFGISAIVLIMASKLIGSVVVFVKVAAARGPRQTANCRERNPNCEEVHH
jgi:hypothetical protein